MVLSRLSALPEFFGVSFMFVTLIAYIVYNLSNYGPGVLLLFLPSSLKLVMKKNNKNLARK